MSVDSDWEQAIKATNKITFAIMEQRKKTRYEYYLAARNAVPKFYQLLQDTKNLRHLWDQPPTFDDKPKPGPSGNNTVLPLWVPPLAALSIELGSAARDFTRCEIIQKAYDDIVDIIQQLRNENDVV